MIELETTYRLLRGAGGGVLGPELAIRLQRSRGSVTLMEVRQDG